MQSIDCQLVFLLASPTLLVSDVVSVRVRSHHRYFWRYSEGRSMEKV